MLTLQEVLEDVAQQDDFADIHPIGVNTRGHSGTTPLHFMATLGDDKAAQLLLNAGAEIDAADANGYTPLHEAIILGHANFVAFLVSKGASISCRNQDGDTALELAEGNDNIKRLLRAGA